MSSKEKCEQKWNKEGGRKERKIERNRERGTGGRKEEEEWEEREEREEREDGSSKGADEGEAEEEEELDGKEGGRDWKKVRTEIGREKEKERKN